MQGGLSIQHWRPWGLNVSQLLFFSFTIKNNECFSFTIKNHNHVSNS